MTAPRRKTREATCRSGAEPEPKPSPRPKLGSRPEARRVRPQEPNPSSERRRRVSPGPRSFQGLPPNQGYLSPGALHLPTSPGPSEINKRAGDGGERDPAQSLGQLCPRRRKRRRGGPEVGCSPGTGSGHQPQKGRAREGGTGSLPRFPSHTRTPPPFPFLPSMEKMKSLAV